MPQLEEQGTAKRRRASSRRSHKMLFAFFCLAVLIYSVFWYFMAERVERRAAAALGQAALSGADMRCRDLSKSGYPLRFAIACDGFSAISAADGRNPPASPADITAWLAGASGAGIGKKDGVSAFRSRALVIGAPVYAPHWISVELTAPAALKLPYAPLIEAEWQSLRAEGDFSARALRNFSLAAENLAVYHLPFLQGAGGGAPLTADFFRFDSRKTAEDKAAFTLSFDNASMPYPPARGPLPKCDGFADIAVDKAEDFYADMRQFLRRPDWAALRGKSAKLNALVLAFEQGGGLSLSGPLAVADNGRVNGRITIAVNDAPALLRTIRAVFPEQADNLESLFFVIGSMPKNARGEPQLTLNIADSHMRIGFLKLGKIPPL